MANTIQHKRGTAANWTAANPVLAIGQVGYEADTGKFKIGNGSTTWSGLDYFASAAVAPTYTITPDPSSIDEGNTLTFNVGGANIADGTYYWTIESNAGDFTATNGSFSISSNVGSFTVTPTADSTTEGEETFEVAIRSDSITGTILQTSSSVTINDTSLEPPPTGQVAYTNPGTYSWVAPAGVTSVSAVLVGGGGAARGYFDKGGGGGALAYRNNISVTPGSSYEVIVGAAGVAGPAYNSATSGGDSSFAGAIAGGGSSSATGGGPGGVPSGTFTGGGNGGQGGDRNSGATSSPFGGGGGAGGYSGNGGRGGGTNGNAGSGSGGGGGGGGYSIGTNVAMDIPAGGGGGVGILGEGASGAGGAYQRGGLGGSGGQSAPTPYNAQNPATTYYEPHNMYGGYYGGGGGSNGGSGYNAMAAGNGAKGAVRIIWGENRAFPSTNTGNL